MKPRAEEDTQKVLTDHHGPQTISDELTVTGVGRSDDDDNTPLKIMGVIPARLASTRLPRKALREIAGKPMIYWVYQNARRSPLLTDLVVATDSPEIQQAARPRASP